MSARPQGGAAGGGAAWGGEDPKQEKNPFFSQSSGASAWFWRGRVLLERCTRLGLRLFVGCRWVPENVRRENSVRRSVDIEVWQKFLESSAPRSGRCRAANVRGTDKPLAPGLGR